MKRSLLLSIILFFSIVCYAQTKAYIDRKTKSFSLTANIRNDHKIFGYASPNINSKKLILFSVFTKDVEGNPYKCTLGSYYDTGGMKQKDRIMYASTSGEFVKLNYITSENKITAFYIRRKFVEFE